MTSEKASSVPATAAPDYDYLCKVIWAGDSGVGKTNLQSRVIHGVDCPKARSTIGVEFEIKTVEVGGYTVKCQMWDTAGQDRYRALTPLYFRQAAAVLIVYDICNRQSFDHLQEWVYKAKDHAAEGVVLMVLGNKVDCPDDERQVTEKEGQDFALSVGALFAEVSAKKDINVTPTFTTLYENLLTFKQSNKESEKMDAVQLTTTEVKCICC
ncbi:P-loop containing nucleoside triphosphate hydrolase protein [Gongronella butleri]|nr:P-loop containing nucleoside triphosphate hydrolase protein [Gongronella butleri]